MFKKFLTAALVVWLTALPVASKVPEKWDSAFVMPDSMAVMPDSVAIKVASAAVAPLKQRSNFRVRDLWLPAGLVAVGAFGVGSHWFHHRINRSVQRGMADIRGDNYLHFDDWVQYLPMASYLVLGSLGVRSECDFRERVAVGATAYLSLGILTNVLKYTVRERRPDSSARNSFPSGHTATVFMGAELLRLEYGAGVAAGGYVVAAGVAFLRLYNNRHWLNDVIAGAGIGILSARIGHWMLPVYRRWFKWLRPGAAVAVAPSYSPTTCSFGVGMVALF